MIDELPPRPGKCKCLKCGKQFDSIDVVRNRICTRCGELNKNVRTCRQASSWVEVNGRRVPMSDDD